MKHYIDKNITEYQEKDIIDFLVSSPFICDVLSSFTPFRSNDISAKKVEIKKEIKSTVFNSEILIPGDIDLLIYNDNLNVMAVECKKIKITTKETKENKIINNFYKNTKRDIEKGLSQVNSLYNFGFAYTYLFIIAEFDNSYYGHQISGLTSYHYEKIKKIVNSFKQNKDLNENIRIGIIEICQPTKKPVYNNGGIGRFELKAGIKKNQDTVITDSMKNLLSVKSNNCA